MDPKKRKLSEKAENGPEPGAASSSSSPPPPPASSSASALTEGEISQLLDPLSREQLLQIARGAAASHPGVLAEVRRLADQDPSFRKLFVRGLSWITSRDRLRSEFSKHGEVEESIVVSDKSTGKSKGFGFVTFKHREGALRALREPSKKIDGQMTVCHLSSSAAATSALAASSSSSSSHARQAQNQVSPAISNRKVYVGNLPKNAHGDALLEFFSRFGEVEEGPLGLDRGTGKCKGFALFIYKSPESAKRCLAEPFKMFHGSQVHCKLAEPSSHKSKDEPLAYDAANSSATGDAMYNPLAVSYDLASPGGALANAYNPSSSLGHSFYGSSSLHAQSSYGQSSLYNAGTPGALSSYGILDPLSSRGMSSSNMLLRGHDSMLESGSVAASLHGLSGMGSHSSLGLPMSSHLSHLSPDSQKYFLQSSRIHPSLRRNNAPSFDYPSLSRSPYY